MNVKQRYWVMLCDKKRLQHYLSQYKEKDEFIEIMLKIINNVITLFGIAGWLSQALPPFMSAAIIAACQVFQVIMPFFPYAKRLTALRYLIPDLNTLVDSIDHDYISIRAFDLPDKYTIEKIKLYEEAWTSMRNKYIEGVNLPTIKKKMDDAMDESRQYAISYYKAGVAHDKA